MEIHEQNSYTVSKKSTFFDFPFFFYSLPLIHLAVALPLAYHLNIWSDEASSLYSTQDGFFVALGNSVNEKQAPLYFIFLSLWRLLDSSIFFARLLSVVCSVFSIGAFFVIVRRFWDEKTALFATFFFSVHPYLFWASTEIRVYSLVITLSLFLLILFERCFLRDENRNAWRYPAFAVLALISLYTNFYLGFLLAGFLVALVILKKVEAAKRYFVVMTFVGVLFFPMIWLAAANSSGSIDGTAFDYGTAEGLRRVWHHLLYFGLPTEMMPPENQTLISLFRLWAARLILLAGAGALFTGWLKPGPRMRFFGTLTFVVAAFLTLSYFVIGTLYVEIRHAAVLFVPFTLLLVAVFNRAAPSGMWRKRYFAVVGVVLIFFYSYGLTAIYPGWTKRGDWTRVAAYVEANEENGQPVVVFRCYEALAFTQSYEGVNKVLPDERFFDWNYEGEMGTVDVWPLQISYVISVIPRDRDFVWLVTEEDCQTSPACLPLENFVKENYTVVRQKDFYKERVRLLKKR